MNSEGVLTLKMSACVVFRKQVLGPNNRMWIVRKDLSEYPLKRTYNFKGLSVRPSERYPFNRADPRCWANQEW